MPDEQTTEPQTEPTDAEVVVGEPEVKEETTNVVPEVTVETATEPVMAEAVVEEVAPVATKNEPAASGEPVEPPFKAKLVGLHELKAGQTVRIHERIVDVSPKGEARERVQVFEGIILGLSGAGIGRTMTARKVSNGVSVEKIYPINSPVIAKIELVKTAKVRRAKLRFLLDLKDRFKRKLKETYVK